MLLPLHSSPVVKGVSVLVVDASGIHGYAAGKDPVGVAVVDLDPATGKWTVAQVVETEAPLTYLEITDDGRFLLGASYHGGCALVWEIVDGVPGVPRARVDHKNLHCVTMVGRDVYAVALGEDLVACYRLTDDGSLVAMDMPTVALMKGSGPRHLVFDDAGRHGYLVTEFTGRVVHLERDGASGVLSLADAQPIMDPDAGLGVSGYGADPRAEHLIWAADVQLVGGGRWLVASERTASTVALLPVAEDGTLGEVVSFVTAPEQPRGLMVGPDDEHVLVAGEKSKEVALYALRAGSAAQGTLVEVARADVDLGGNWVRFTHHGE